MLLLHNGIFHSKEDTKMYCGLAVKMIRENCDYIIFAYIYKHIKVKYLENIGLEDEKSQAI